jgi:phosphoenolpyruvate phosphomutase
LDEVKEFIEKFKKFAPDTPIVLVPTTYNSIHEKIFEDLGVNILIYANHQIRASILSMMNACESILKNQRSLESEENILAVKALLDYIPGTR